MDELLTSEDFEEWDGSSPFWIHCVAGSCAGLVEHTLVYPLDTVRTHIQVCASCMVRRPKTNTNIQQQQATLRGGGRFAPLSSHHLPTGMWQTIRYLMNEPTMLNTTTAPTTTSISLWGWTRLWRGVQAIVIGCIPAHAAYFSSYEIVKAATLDSNNNVTTYGSSLAGAAAVLSHDLFLTPLDTLKQRMQLGHYTTGVTSALRTIVHTEGWRALYRSFPITLATNIPYGMVMVTTHEAAKQAWASPDIPEWQTVLWASSVAGLTAAAVTTPLDRIKTALQTQQLAPASSCFQGHCRVQHSSWQDAAKHIWKQEGWVGFARGLVPRILSHTPAVAISWTTYETTKHYLLQQYN